LSCLGWMPVTIWPRKQEWPNTWWRTTSRCSRTQSRNRSRSHWQPSLGVRGLVATIPVPAEAEKSTKNVAV